MPWSLRARVELAAAIALTTAIGALALHQRHVADELSTAIAELRRDFERGVSLELAHAPSSSPLLGTSISKPPVPAPLAIGERERLESRGAGLLAANDYEGAREHYRKLAAVAPEDEVFRTLVIVLESKLRCAQRAMKTGSPCP